MKKKTRMVVCSLLLSNVLLIFLLLSLSIKFHIHDKIAYKLGIVEENPTNAPDYWAIRGWTNMIEKLEYNADIVFFGNSITAGSDFRIFFPNKKIVNLGYPGDGIRGMLRRTKQISSLRPKYIFMMAGINGLKFQTKEMFSAMYGQLVDSIIVDNPNAKIFLQSILPVNKSYYNQDISNRKIVEANSEIERIAKERNITYINLSPLYCTDGELAKEYTRDGVHLYPEAYKRWGEKIREYVE